MPSASLLVMGREPGGASALVSVALRARAEVVAYPSAATVFERAGLKPRAIVDDDAAAVRSILGDFRPDVLVTGTSHDAGQENVWWTAARERGIPSLAVLDHWDNYAERFTVRRPFDALPDRITVMDERALAALIGHGCPPELVVITGQPAFDALLEAQPPGRDEARRAWSVDPRNWVILFASEPISSDHVVRQYNETQALAVLLEATATLPATVLVRPHPRQSQDSILSVFPTVRIDRTRRPHDALAGADTIVGMESMFLLEAAIAGAPVLSVQPSPLQYPVPGNCRSLIATARTAGETRAWLEDPGHQRRLVEAKRIARNRACGFFPGATARVLREVERLLASRL